MQFKNMKAVQKMNIDEKNIEDPQILQIFCKVMIKLNT